MREDEQLLAQKRMRDDGVATSKKINLQTFKTILSSWHIYIATAMITIFLVETYPAGQSASLTIAIVTPNLLAVR